MRLPCATQLQRSQLPCSRTFSCARMHLQRAKHLVLRAKNSNQKNEGVYFEYEVVDPDAAEEIAALQEEDAEQFSWAQRSRDRRKAHQDKVRGLMPHDLRRQRKGGQRGSRANDAAVKERRQSAAEAAAVTASDGPVLPSFSPVETPAMRARAMTPEELLIRPNGGKPDTENLSSTIASSKDQISGNSNGSPAVPGASSEIAAVVATEEPATAAPPTVSNRRQRLLQRMKGNGGSGTTDPSTGPAATTATDQGLQDMATDVALGTSTAEVAAAAGSPSAAAGADLRAQLAALVEQLPQESELPADARNARALLASILSATGEDIRDATAGDMTDMLQRDRSAQQEFAEWLRSASSAERGGGGSASTAADLAGTEELTEAEAADLMAALANLDLEGDLADLGADLDLGLGERADDDGNGDAAIGAAVREVSELRQLMAQLAGDDGGGLAEETGSREDMTDEQVLEALKASDPALYELLKDVPEFDKLDLDLDLNLDLESATEQLTEEELAELAAETEAANAGGDDEEELEALLRDMKGMGLMREKGSGAADGEDDDEDDEEGDLALGDLLEAIDEDEELDSRARMRAQFALQSMFNQPADELAAKGTRGSGGEDNTALPMPVELRGTTGMARGAVAADDEDGGAAPPPVLPKPKPRPRSG
ncbi:hypothetical protein Vretimale_6777 [Volvox reticuliferus]|uniref:Uncharacterized protein n=1 Tax=Volvox reticuliferus TaxID=1737510 RepID=A0A8J4G8D0_9CHLO|nr:hypothetical protein Vretifemale_7156 [Volvox reticuliferus]GIM02035.1 hypothetical protein Vretimale_6777 [Volvox reticuliferus]